MGTITRGRLAALTGVSIETVRYYHRIGLLPEPPRNGSGYRQYTADDVGRLLFVRRAKGLGFRLDEIAELLDLRDDPYDACGCVQGKVVQALDRLEHQSRQLEAVMSQLGTWLTACRQNGTSRECVLLEALAGDGRHDANGLSDLEGSEDVTSSF